MVWRKFKRFFMKRVLENLDKIRKFIFQIERKLVFPGENES